MKKFILTMMIALVLPLWNADARKKDMSDLTALIKEYKSYDSFDCVSVGGVLLSLMRSMVRSEAAGDPDAMAALSLLKGINHITVADYDDCPSDIKASFVSRATAILGSFEMLMEAKDSESSIVIYGNMSHNAEILNDVIVYAPQDGALICIEGKISMSDLGTIMESTKKKK